MQEKLNSNQRKMGSQAAVSSESMRSENTSEAACDTVSGVSACPSVAFVTMGCAKNEADTASMQKKLIDAGYAIESSPEEADVVVVNTCSFIQSATEESIEVIFDACNLPKIEAGSAALIVAGCMPARYGQDLTDELTEVETFLPCANEDTIVSVVEEALLARGVSLPDADQLASRELPSCQQFDQHSSPQTSPQANGALNQPKLSVYVKISEGCDRFCSYCTIPYIRGRYHSFPFTKIEAEVAEQIAQGAREIVLIAQDTGRWGSDFENPSSLAELVSTLAKAHPETWFRIMYIQPEGITDNYIQAVASHENICSYFDIPLQHISEPILKAMRRKGSADSARKLALRIKKTIPDAVLRTTLIAGFPGESEEEFEALCDFVEEGLFDYVGVFAYSREEGTRAYGLANQLDEDVKAERAQRLRDVADASCVPNISARIDTIEDVLIEGCEEDGQLFGRSKRQAPDVDGLTYIDAGEVGEVVHVRIIDALMYEMEGQRI